MSSTTPAPAAPDGADPSMEEILASIRRILNDDETPGATPAETPPEAEADDDVLILDETMMVAAPEPEADVFAEPPPEPAVPASHEPAAPVDFDDMDFNPPPLRLPPPDEPVHIEQAAPASMFLPDPVEPPPPTPDLIGPEAAAAAASSVGALVRTLSATRATQVYTGGPTLEDMVRSELRPLLKDWLDQNLPPMVERLVRAEIERVVGRFVP